MIARKSISRSFKGIRVALGPSDDLDRLAAVFADKAGVSSPAVFKELFGALAREAVQWRGVFDCDDAARMPGPMGEAENRFRALVDSVLECRGNPETGKTVFAGMEFDKNSYSVKKAASPLCRR